MTQASSRGQWLRNWGNSWPMFFHCTQPPLAEVTKLLCPHHEGAGAPHPFRVGGPDLWYQMTLVDTTVERSLVSSAGGARR